VLTAQLELATSELAVEDGQTKLQQASAHWKTRCSGL